MFTAEGEIDLSLLSKFQPNDRVADFCCGAKTTSVRYAVLRIPPEDFQSIARFLAAGYLRLRDRNRAPDSLATPPKSSPHGHEVNAFEKGETSGTLDPRAD